MWMPARRPHVSAGRRRVQDRERVPRRGAPGRAGAHRGRCRRSCRCLSCAPGGTGQRCECPERPRTSSSHTPRAARTGIQRRARATAVYLWHPSSALRSGKGSQGPCLLLLLLCCARAASSDGARVALMTASILVGGDHRGSVTGSRVFNLSARTCSLSSTFARVPLPASLGEREGRARLKQRRHGAAQLCGNGGEEGGGRQAAEQSAAERARGAQDRKALQGVHAEPCHGAAARAGRGVNLGSHRLLPVPGARASRCVADALAPSGTASNRSAHRAPVRRAGWRTTRPATWMAPTTSLR